MYANVRGARCGDRRGTSTRVTPDVPIDVLGYFGPTSSFYLRVSTINEAHPIALVGVELFQRATEPHMVRARPIRRLTRL